MQDALRFFLKKQPVLLGICVTALVFTLFFGIKFALHLVWINDPAHRDPELESWMRPRYVAMTYRIPPHVLAEGLGIAPPKHGEGHRRESVTMADVAEELGIDLDTLTERVRAVAADFDEERAR